MTTAPPPDAAAVASAFGLGRPVAEPQFAARGELGRIWRLETDLGLWAVKQMLRPPSLDEVLVDIELQTAARSLGVPAPRPVLTPDGRPVVTVASAHSSDSVRVHEWVDLQPGPVSVSAAQAAAILGVLHQIDVVDPLPPDPWFVEAVADARFYELADVAKKTAWGDHLRSRANDLVAASRLIMRGAAAATITCHRDFNRQNVLLTSDGHPMVLDWENAGRYVPEHELAGTLAEFEVPLEGVTTFLAAYSDAGGPVSRLRAESFAGILAVQGNLLVHYAEQALGAVVGAEVGAEERARAEFWLNDMLTNLITVERVQAWVAAQ